MKNTMKLFALCATVLAFSAALASCQKEKATLETSEVHVFHVELDATVTDTKATYATTSKQITFESGDALYVALTQPTSAEWSAATGTLTYDGTSFKGDITYTGTYSGSDIITDAKDLAATFLPKNYSTVNYLSATGTTTATNAFYAGEKSASVPQLVHLTASITDQAGSAKSPLALSAQNAVLCYSINANKLSAGAHTVSVSDGTTTISGSVTAVADAATTFAVAFPANATALTYTLSIAGYNDVAKSGKTLVAGKVVNIATDVEEATISGVFSVGPTTTVKFSKGNLQATTTDLGATWTWAFAANQWSYVGNAAANTSMKTDGTGTVTANGTVDLFGWVGASSSWTTAAKWGISASTTSADYGNVADEALKSDWGNVPGIGTGWRTLTGGSGGEWEWILGPSSSPVPGTNCRESSTIGSTDNARYVKATVHNTKGLILFPDVITWNATTMGVAPTTCNTKDNNFTYSPANANWAALEAAGCVFLPAAGYRNGTSVYNVGSLGYYWSSSPNGSSKAYCLYFYIGNVDPAHDSSRHDGSSVRLVQNQ